MSVDLLIVPVQPPTPQLHHASVVRTAMSPVGGALVCCTAPYTYIPQRDAGRGGILLFWCTRDVKESTSVCTFFRPSCVPKETRGFNKRERSELAQ
jgi:hypothetical protein